MKTKIFSKIYYLIIALAIISLQSCNGTSKENSSNKDSLVSSTEKAWQQVPEILKNIIPPAFPEKQFDITKYGAVPDGKTLCTEAFKKAIEECNKSGGGIVLVPKGTFLTGAIHLKDNVNLHISKDAVVKFSLNPKDYLPVVQARWEGVDLMNYSPLIYAYNQKNIAVTGEGLLDGQASDENWWKWKGRKTKDQTKTQGDSLSRPRLLKMNDDGVPVEKRIFGEGTYLRPTFVEFYKCENILIENVTLKDSPFWFLHPVLSNNITIKNVTTSGLGPNNDGCDPESSSNILIQGCTFNNGDDCIAIKSGRNGDGRRINTPSKNIIIRDCNMKDGHGGVSIGSEITGGCWNVFVENCEMDSPNLDRALRIKSNSKRGGTVKNIYMRNVTVGQVKEAVVRLNMNYDPKEAKGYTYYPDFENIIVQNVNSQKSIYGIYLEGLSESKIKNVLIQNCKFNGVENGNNIQNVTGLHFDEYYVNGKLQEVANQ